MKVLSIAVLALALCPGIDASDTPHGTPRREKKGRVRVGQREGSRERGYADVEEESVKTRSGGDSIESRAGGVRWVQLKKIKCVQASTDWDWNRFISVVGTILGGCGGAGGDILPNTIDGTVCFVAVNTASYGGYAWDWNEIMGGTEISDYPDNLQIWSGEDKVYPTNADFHDMNTGDEVAIPGNERAQTARKISSFPPPSYCLMEWDNWGDDAMGCITFTDEMVNDSATEYQAVITDDDAKSVYYLEFEVFTEEVAVKSPKVYLTKIKCHEVEDSGWWEDDEIALFVNDRKVWPRGRRDYEITDGETAHFGSADQNAGATDLSSNANYCLWDYDGSTKADKIGCVRFNPASLDNPDCNTNSGYEKTERVWWSGGGSNYEVTFQIRC